MLGDPNSTKALGGPAQPHRSGLPFERPCRARPSRKRGGGGHVQNRTDAYLWPSIVFRAMRIHIPVERLSAVADSGNSILTTQEFGHLKVCTECFSTWIEFIRQVVRVSLLGRSQIITWHSERGVSSSNLSSPGFDSFYSSRIAELSGKTHAVSAAAKQ